MRGCSGHNIPKKGVHTIHKAKVYTSLLRPEQGVRLIYGCVLYTQNYGNWKVFIMYTYVLSVI